MKSRIIGIVAVIAVLVGVGLWFVMGQGEAETEKLVRETLESFGIQAEKIEVGLAGRKLYLENVTYDTVLGRARITSRIGSVNVTGFHVDSLTPSEGGKVPLVAEEIIIRDSKSTVSMDLEVPDRDPVTYSYDVASGEVYMKNWHQNLGNLSREYGEGAWSAAFFAEAYRFSLDDFYCKDYTVTGDMSHLKALRAGNPAFQISELQDLYDGEFAYRLGKIGMLGKAGSVSGDPEAGRKFSFFADDLNIVMGEMMNATVARMEVNDVLLPTPQGMAELMQIIDTMQVMDPATFEDPDNPLTLELLAWAKKEYSEQAPYARLFFRDYRVTFARMDEEVVIALGELENTLAFGTPFNVGLNMRQLVLPENDIPADTLDVLKEFMPGGLKGDVSLQVSLSPAAQGDSSLVFGSKVATLGQATVDVGLILEVENLAELTEGPGMERKILFRGMESEMKDSGLLAMLVCLIAEEQDMSVEEVRLMMGESIPPSMAGMGPNAPAMTEALLTMLDRPGTLEITLQPRQPMPVSELVMSFLFGMPDLDLNLKAVPGPKDLMEHVPASLK